MEQSKRIKEAETFVRKVLMNDFHQKPTNMTIRNVALKVVRSTPPVSLVKNKG